MDKKQIINRMYEIQNQYNNNIKEFQNNKEFIELASKIGNYKSKTLSANKIIEIKHENCKWYKNKECWFEDEKQTGFEEVEYCFE